MDRLRGLIHRIFHGVYFLRFRIILDRSRIYKLSYTTSSISISGVHLYEVKPSPFHVAFLISGHTITMHTLSYAIKFWSKGTKQAYFIRHEGYLGAIGAFLRHQPSEWIRRFSATRRDIIPFLPKDVGGLRDEVVDTDE